jgi:isopenicillin-N N-acyltransferase like protein
MLDLPTITIAGTPAAMGAAHGLALRREIRAFTAQRLRAARAFLFEHGSRDLDGLLRLGRACLDRLEAWDPDGWAEHRATAEAAGVDAVELYTAGNMTDVRDILLLGSGPGADAEGCSTALVPPGLTADGDLIAAQTWDLNPTDLDFVVAIHRRPSAGPACWTVTCAGCPSLMGMNSSGLAFGTTNIRVGGCRPGIPYLSLLHRAARCANRAEAAAIITDAPRCAAHTYWFADAGGALDLECSADAVQRREAGPHALNRTNHCLDAAHAARQAESASASSSARFARVGGWLARGRQDVVTLKALFADRSDGVDAVNRLPEDNQGTTTNACLIAVPARRELHACRGPADRGAWIRLPFDPAA